MEADVPEIRHAIERARIARADIGIEYSHSRGSSLMSDTLRERSEALREQLLGVDSAAAESSRRVGGIKSSIYTLISTMMGGGILSLPYAMQQAGLVCGCALLLAICLASRLSLWLVLTTGCSLRAGSYEEMVALTLGRRSAEFVTAILILLLWFVVVAYSILLGDLLGPLLAFCARGYISDAVVKSHAILSLRSATMLAGHVAVFPVTSLPSITAMRVTSAISLSTTALLALLISARSVATMLARGSVLDSAAPISSALWPAGGVRGVLNSASIVAVSFLCHFNLLPVSEELARPSKSRYRKIVDRTTALGGVLYLCVGVLGFLQFAGTPGGVAGNILLNYPSSDLLINLGRLGLSLTVSIGIALMVHPLRAAIRRFLPPVWQPPTSQPSPALVDAETTARLVAMGAIAAPAKRGVREVTEALFIQLTGLLAAIFIPEITAVWSFMGSTVGLLIGYVIPAACYLALRRWDSQTHLQNYRGAWVLAVVGAVLTVVCTVSTLTQYLL